MPVDRVYAETRDGEPEQLWARLRGDGVYELVSVPFDAYGLNVGDLVGCEPDPATGRLMVRDVEEASRGRTLRIIYNEKTTRAAERNGIQQVLDEMGADIYPLSERYVAVDLPADTDYDAVFDFLASETEATALPSKGPGGTRTERHKTSPGLDAIRRDSVLPRCSLRGSLRGKSLQINNISDS